MRWKRWCFKGALPGRPSWRSAFVGWICGPEQGHRALHSLEHKVRHLRSGLAEHARSESRRLAAKLETLKSAELQAELAG